MLKVKLQSNNNNEVKGNLVKALNGVVSLDDIINDVVFDNHVESDEEIERKVRFMKQMDVYSERYLTDSERLVYNLYIKDKKTIAEIKTIMGFGCWYTAESHVIKVFKIMKIYHDYHSLDLRLLNSVLKSNFTTYERQILNRLHNRKTYNEITNELGGYYRKIYYDCVGIFSKLENLGEVGEGYATFLKEIRRFKNRG